MVTCIHGGGSGRALEGYQFISHHKWTLDIEAHLGNVQVPDVRNLRKDRFFEMGYGKRAGDNTMAPTWPYGMIQGVPHQIRQHQ